MRIFFFEFSKKGVQWKAMETSGSPHIIPIISVDPNFHLHGSFCSLGQPSIQRYQVPWVNTLQYLHLIHSLTFLFQSDNSHKQSNLTTLLRSLIAVRHSLKILCYDVWKIRHNVSSKGTVEQLRSHDQNHQQQHTE